MSTNEQVIKKYLEDSNRRQWTDAQILALSPKMRSDLASYGEKDGMPINKISSELKELISRRGFSPADGRAALAMIQDKTINPMTQSNSEWIGSKGGSEVFTLSTSTLYMCNGEKVERPLTPIPANPANKDKYSNLDALTAFCGALVTHEEGQWRPSQEVGWAKVFPTLSASGLSAVAQLVSKLLTSDPAWEAMTQTTKSSMTGRNAAVFMRNAFNSLSTVVYNYLNTKIVVDAFRAIEKDQEGDWVLNCDEDGNDVVPSKLYDNKVKTQADRDFSTDYPSTLLYRGGWCPAARLPKVDCTQTSSLLAARQKSVEVAKGDSAIPTLIAKSQGYSGMTTEAAKVHYFVIASTLEAWRRGKVVNIRLTTDGDINILYCSLTYWQEEARKNAMFKEMHMISSSWFYFIPAKRNANPNVSVQVKELIIFNHQLRAVAVAVLDDTIKTKVDKDSDPINHDAASASVLPADLPAEYIVKCPIYGTAFFPKDTALTRSKQKGTSLEDLGKQYKEVLVYGHGSAANFIGVASTFPDLHLVGAEQVKMKMEFVVVPLVPFATRIEWYKKISVDINMIYRSVFSPVSTFSPITNLLVVQKGKVSILQDLNEDAIGGAYSGKVFVRGGQKRKKFIAGGEAPTTTAGVAPPRSTTSSSAFAVPAPMSTSPMPMTLGVSTTAPPPPQPPKAKKFAIPQAPEIVPAMTPGYEANVTAEDDDGPPGQGEQEGQDEDSGIETVDMNDEVSYNPFDHNE
jgi:hypothetical protein